MAALSGPAIKPIALRLVYEASQAVKIPIAGLGGIATGEDAAEFLIAGATVVQVGTASFWDPTSPARIARQLGEFLRQEAWAAVRSLRYTQMERMKKIISTDDAPQKPSAPIRRPSSITAWPT